MFHPHGAVYSRLSIQYGCFVMLPIQIGGIVFTVSHRKRIVTGVTDRGSEFAMWWSGTASINLSVILSRRWSLNTGCHSGRPLFTRLWLCLWESLILSPPFPVFFGPLRSFTGFYLNFTSCPFSVYYFLKSNSGSLEKGGRREAC